MTKADLALVISLLGLLATLGLSPTLLVAALAGFLVGKAVG